MNQVGHSSAHWTLGFSVSVCREQSSTTTSFSILNHTSLKWVWKSAFSVSVWICHEAATALLLGSSKMPFDKHMHFDKQQCRYCLYTFVQFLHTLQWKYKFGCTMCRTLPEKSWCIIYCSELFIMKYQLFCFAYNCKNTVKFNNHIAFFPFYHLPKKA